MDLFKLLSRSTKLSRNTSRKDAQSTPSSGSQQPQLPAQSHETLQNRDRKRKRDEATQRDDGAHLDFFGSGDGLSDSAKKQKRVPSKAAEQPETNDVVEAGVDEVHLISIPRSLEDRKRLLKQHKLKVTWINPPRPSKRNRRKDADTAKRPKDLLFPDPLESFESLRGTHRVSSNLIANICDQGYIRPTEVQVAGLPILLGGDLTMGDSRYPQDLDAVDLLTVAPTGSGKTLAFMIPLLHRIQSQRQAGRDAVRRTSAIILAPTKELAGQIVNEGRKLAKRTGVSISQMRKGMRLATDAVAASHDNNDTVPDEEFEGTVVKADVLVSTPGLLQSAVDALGEPTSEVRYLILDEADVLLDPLFRDQTALIWNSLTHPELRVSMWSATMGSNIEDLAKLMIKEYRQRSKLKTGNRILEAPLVRLVVGLKDSAVPNVEHKLVYAATEQGKLMGLRQLLHPTAASANSEAQLRPPFLVFTQTIERAIALHSELVYDIPAEAGGISRIAVLHADLSDTARDSIMTRFRKGEVWILITTDLLSRGVDFLGINGVVNYDIPTSSAAYVHRVGRTGRAGREGGVAVTLYSKEDIPYMKHVANVISMAQKTKGEDRGVQQWLLDALPKLGRNDKQNFKKHGIESRTNRGAQKDPRAARKARISTKAGFVRRAEHNRRGAILGSQRRQKAAVESNDQEENEFEGFD